MPSDPHSDRCASLLGQGCDCRSPWATDTAGTYTWEFCRSCGGAGWVGSRINHEHPSCGHRCILCYPPPGYDRTYAVEATDGI